MDDLDPGLDALRRSAVGGVPMIELEPAAVRERVAAGNRLCADGPPVRVRSLTAKEDAAPVPLRVYEGDEAAAATLVYAHGGGWVTGDLGYSDELCRFLAHDGGVRVVSVDYRLAPEHPFPAGLDDVAAAWRWTGVHYDGPCALGGDSSGGNLAAALALRLASTGDARPSFLLLIYPVLDLPDRTESYRTNANAFPIGAADMRWFFDHYTRGSGVADPGPDLAPRQATDLAGLPRTHVVLAGHDPLHDEGKEFAAGLVGAGVPVTVAAYPSLGHGFLRFTGASQAARRARSAVVTEVRRLAALGVNSSRPAPIHAYDSAAMADSTPGKNARTRR